MESTEGTAHRAMALPSLTERCAGSSCGPPGAIRWGWGSAGERRLQKPQDQRLLQRAEWHCRG